MILNVVFDFLNYDMFLYNLPTEYETSIEKQRVMSLF